MNPIEISKTSWHCKFIDFMGRDLYRVDNTCAYIRTFGFAVLLLAFFASLCFLLAFSATYGVIVSAIFMYNIEISMEVLNMAINALPTPFNFIFALITVISGFVLAAGLLLLLIGTVIMGADVTKSTFRKHCAEKIQESTTYQIASAWHSKICRPIKVADE